MNSHKVKVTRPKTETSICSLGHAAKRRGRADPVGLPGHADAGFTLRACTHTTSRQQVEAADRMGSLIKHSL